MNERVLKAVGQMIHVIDQSTSPKDFPALDVGRNILDIIGEADHTLSST